MGLDLYKVRISYYCCFGCVKLYISIYYVVLLSVCYATWFPAYLKCYVDGKIDLLKVETYGWGTTRRCMQPALNLWIKNTFMVTVKLSLLSYLWVTNYVLKIGRKKTPWSESASELYRPSDRRLSAKWLPTCADRGVPRGQRDWSLRPYSRFSRPEPLPFLSSSSSVVLTRLSGPRSRPTTFFPW
jgi:hypothetical protein